MKTIYQQVQSKEEVKTFRPILSIQEEVLARQIQLKKIRRHPRVAQSIHNLFAQQSNPNNSERCKSSQRTRIVRQSNRLQSASNCFALFSRVYHPMSKRKSNSGSLHQDPYHISEIEANKNTGESARRYKSSQADLSMLPLVNQGYLKEFLLGSPLANTSQQQEQFSNRLRHKESPSLDPIRQTSQSTATKAKQISTELKSSMVEEGGGLKIFQKLSESLLQQKNIISLRASMTKAPDDKLQKLMTLVALNNFTTIPELPLGR